METRSRVIGVLALASALAALAFLFVGRDASRVRRLPDGSYLRIASVEYGTKHTYSLPSPRPWQAFLARYMPDAWTDRFGWRGGNATVGAMGRAAEDTLAIVTVCELANPSSFEAPQLALLDEQGREYAASRPVAAVATIVNGHNRRLTLWSFTIFPPADKPLVLRFSFTGLDSAGKVCPVHAEFHVPNPGAPGTK